MKKPYESRFFLVLDYYLLSQLEKDYPIDISDFVVFTYLLFCFHKNKQITHINKVIVGHTRVKLHSVRSAINKLESWGLIEVETKRDYSHNFKHDRTITISKKFLTSYKFYDDYKEQKSKSPSAKTHPRPECENESHISN